MGLLPIVMPYLILFICGFISPYFGNVIIDGVDIYKNNCFSKNIGILIDKSDFIPKLMCFDNLKLVANINNRLNDEKIFEIMNTLNLLDYFKKKFKTCSLGTKQKIGIAQALMEDPYIIILNETFNGVDDISINIVREYLIKKKVEGKLIIVETHIKEDIDNLCDIIYVVKDKKIDIQKKS